MKSILALADDGEQLEATLRTAALLARRADGRLNVLHVRALPAGVAYPSEEFALPGLMLERPAVDERGPTAERARHARSCYERVVAPHWSRSAWWEADGHRPALLTRLGRVSDLVVIGRPADDVDPATVKAALFDTGRPVLVAPPAPLPTIATRVALAWSNSVQAARSVGAAMPLIVQAAETRILIAGPQSARGSADGVLGYLDSYGVNARVDTYDPGPGSARARGRSLLRHAVAMGADLLVMGAYGEGRLVQFLGLGGATAKAITANTMPLLLAN